MGEGSYEGHQGVGDGKHGAREKRQAPDPRESGPSLGRTLFLSCLDHNCLSHLFLSTRNRGWQWCLWAMCSALSSDSHGCLS